jgi:hypothetical protein
MRKLVLTSVLCLLAAVPAFAIADTDGESLRGAATAPADALATSSGLTEQLRIAAARRVLRLAVRRAQPPQPKPVAVPPHLQAIAECESGGDPTAIGGGGLYRGKYQFSVATWQAVGGSGDPAAAPEAEQDRRAIILYERSGPGQWPVCGS